LGCHHHPLPQQPELHSLRYYAVGDEVPLGRFVRTLLRQAQFFFTANFDNY
jgi:hypothetical protein